MKESEYKDCFKEITQTKPEEKKAVDVCCKCPQLPFPSFSEKDKEKQLCGEKHFTFQPGGAQQSMN